MTTFDLFGVIRNGSPWYIIDDADHTPLNLTGISTVNGSSTSGYVRVDFPAVTVVGAAVVCPDEYMVQNGYAAGASVSTDHLKIYFSHNNAAVAPNSVPGGTANFWIMGKMWGGVSDPEPDPDGWTTIYEGTPSGNSNGWTSATCGVYLPHSKFSNVPSASLTEVRITTCGGTSEGFQAGALYVGHPGTLPSWSAAGTQLSNSGGTSGTSPANGTLQWTGNFAYDKTSGMLIFGNCTGSAGADSTKSDYANTGGYVYEKGSSADAASTTKSGYTAYSGARALVVKIEVK